MSDGTDNSRLEGQKQSDTAAKADADTDIDELPAEAVDEAERLTRIARAAVDADKQAAAREQRATVLDRHGFTARVREDDDGDVLVLHPAEWHDSEDGVIRTDRIEDLSRAHEQPLTVAGAGDPDDWEAVEAQNRDLAETVREQHGDVHGDNVELIADFMSNHYARPIESATQAEITEFLSEYFVRNAWPSESQKKMIEESIELAFDCAGKSMPETQ